MKNIFLLLSLLIFTSGNSHAESNVDGRWYTKSQVSMGRVVFEKNCAACHGDKAQGITADWKKTLADGSYPPPPLNGTAHAWHHSKKILKNTINQGGVAWGGKMPSFKDTLTEGEKEDVIAFFQSLWKKKTYDSWLKRGGLK